MSTKAYLAFDLGAESGRAMLGVIEDGKLALHEVHRFANTLHRLPDGLHWNTLGLWANLIEGLRRAGEFCRDRDWHLVSLGVDTWGVDFGLIGESGGLLGLPFAYREPRNNKAMAKTLERIGAERLYGATGIQFMALNTLFQLIAMADAEPGLVQRAKHLLWTPDLLHYFFTGEARHESSIASTSQMVDAARGGWIEPILHELGLPTGMLGSTMPPGTVVGPLLEHVAEEADVEPSVKVIAPASHDTASAVAATPAQPGSEDWCYLSSGTWSLMGVELNQPVLTGAAREAGFTNEGGVDGTIRFLTNIGGLWLVQEIRRAYEKQGESYDYEALTRLAGQAEPFRTIVDPDHGPFMQPGDMPEKLAAFAESTNQPKPESIGQFVRCALESLALTYRRTLENLQRVLDRKLRVIHILGGGGRNKLLSQMTADATGLPVTAGPFEATAAGNVLVQAMGAGDVDDLAHLRRIIRDSFDPVTYEPTDIGRWNDAYARYQAVIGK